MTAPQFRKLISQLEYVSPIFDFQNEKNANEREEKKRYNIMKVEWKKRKIIIILNLF
jgi:hypothetical protein